LRKDKRTDEFKLETFGQIKTGLDGRKEGKMTEEE